MMAPMLLQASVFIHLQYLKSSRVNMKSTRQPTQSVQMELMNLSLQSELLKGNRQLKKSLGLLSPRPIKLSHAVVDSLRGMGYCVGMH